MVRQDPARRHRPGRLHLGCRSRPQTAEIHSSLREIGETVSLDLYRSPEAYSHLRNHRDSLLVRKKGSKRPRTGYACFSPLGSISTIQRVPKDEQMKRALVIVTFDESEGDNEPERIYTVFLGSMVKPEEVTAAYDHYSVLRTIEDNFWLDPISQRLRRRRCLRHHRHLEVVPRPPYDPLW